MITELQCLYPRTMIPIDNFVLMEFMANPQKFGEYVKNNQKIEICG